MLLLLVRVALQDLIQPRLAAGEVEVFVVGEALLVHRGGAAAGPGGVTYLVVRRQGVKWFRR